MGHREIQLRANDGRSKMEIPELFVWVVFPVVVLVGIALLIKDLGDRYRCPNCEICLPDLRVFVMPLREVL